MRDEAEEGNERLTSIEWQNLSYQMPLCNEIPALKRGPFIRGICEIRRHKEWISDGLIISHDWINLVSAHLSLLSLGYIGEPFLQLRSIRFCRTYSDARVFSKEREHGIMSVSVGELEATALGNKSRANSVVTEAIFFSNVFSVGSLVPLPPGSENPRDWAHSIRTERSRSLELDRTSEEALITRLAIPAEVAFLSVATQMFFEEPSSIARKYRTLYILLKHLYALDPSSKTWEAHDIKHGVYEEFVTSDTQILRK